MKETTFIILGATGDLTKRKLIPAIYKLVVDKKIDKFLIIGVANSQTTIKEIFEKSKPFIPKVDEKIWQEIQNNSFYQQLNFYDSNAYKTLKTTILEKEKSNKLCGNKMFYLATMPEHFEVITKNLALHKIVEKHESKSYCQDCKHPWSRIVYEKPFGFDLKSAKKINSYISKCFHETQIYRIDHYLGKEIVGNIALIRFTNKIFEPLWNNKNINSIQIILNEKIGIENRGAFYDKYGVLKDIIQNHILQILSLVAMEPPKDFSAQSMRNAKARVLKKVKIESTILGQYQGYKEEQNINPKSTTETFAALKLSINNKRWRGVPFYIKAGKCLDKKETSIHIKFKMVKCLLSKSCPTDSNYLTLKVEPDDGFFLELNAKTPGTNNEITPVSMNFCHSCIFGPNTPASYEILLSDVINGDQSTFIRSDEIELSWKIIEQIDKSKLEIYTYPKGSSGPKELSLLDRKTKIKWRA